MKRTATPAVLVIGGGVAGQRAALALCDVGVRTILVERSASLGGHVAQLGSMFPQQRCLLCRGEPTHGPGCVRPGLSYRLLDGLRPSALTIHTMTEVVRVEGEPGRFTVTLEHRPRYVDPERCTLCNRCAEVCPVELPDPFQAGLITRKAAYKPAPRAIPNAYAIEKVDPCASCGRCAEVCPTGAIDLTEVPHIEQVKVGAIIIATGSRLYNARLSQEFGYGRFPNVITALEMERMLAPDGPTEGRLLRPSDRQPPQRIAWLQCVGSRDREHPYCSAVCCMYATRQAVTACEAVEDGLHASIFLMDHRVFAQGFSTTYAPLRERYGIELIRFRVATLKEDPFTRNLHFWYETERGERHEAEFDMVVLSIGLEGNADVATLFGLQPDANGFLRTGLLDPSKTGKDGIFVAGTAASPADIADAVTSAMTAAAHARSFLGHLPLPTEPEEEHKEDGPGRIGVAICRCAGEIDGVIDVDLILSATRGRSEVVWADAVPFGCLPEGLAQIRQAIQEHDLDHLVIGACVERTYRPRFEQTLGVPVTFVPLREGCTYLHRDDPAGATQKAHELIRIGVVRARLEEPIPPVSIVPHRSVAVIGGGLAGMTAALHLADGGIEVHLIERETELGGHWQRLHRTIDGSPLDLRRETLIAQVKGHPRISLHLGYEPTWRTGHLGAFRLGIRPGKQEQATEATQELEVGALVVTTGGEEYRGSLYALGKHSSVCTLLDLEELLTRDPEAPKQWKQVVLIGCVGPWDEPGSTERWRCSRVCCEGIFKHAMAIKHANPTCQVIVFTREVNAYGFREEYYTEVRRLGVLFVRYTSEHRPEVLIEGDRLRVHAYEPSLQEDLDLAPDMLVLGMGIVPRQDTRQVAETLGLSLSAEGFLETWEEKTLPFATAEPGIFLAGLVQGPKPSGEVIAQALAAAESALALVSQPRLRLNGRVAQVDPARCMGCLTCVRVCPYGVPRIDPTLTGKGGIQGASTIDAARCQGCGTCVAECPGRAIELRGYSDGYLTGTEEPLLGRWEGIRV